MTTFFNAPYKETGSVKSKLIAILAFGLFIFLFLFIFRPFGLSDQDLKTSRVALITFGFGIVTSVVLVIFIFLIEPAFKRQHTTLGQIVFRDFLIVIVIGAANYFYMYLIFNQDFDLVNLFYSIWTAILVGILPVTINHILTYNRLYRNALEEAEIPVKEILHDEEVCFTAGNPRNNVKVKPSNIIYLCSNDNYVTIVTIKENAPHKTTIRGTLKSAEEELKNYSNLVRCHKCYIVNLDFVDHVIGGGQNMKLKISLSGIEIPVARTRTRLITKKTRNTLPLK